MKRIDGEEAILRESCMVRGVYGKGIIEYKMKILCGKNIT